MLFTKDPRRFRSELNYYPCFSFFFFKLNNFTVCLFFLLLFIYLIFLFNFARLAAYLLLFFSKALKYSIHLILLQEIKNHKIGMPNFL